ncbi:NAD(P)/FAD-dependent oxidoreductase [Scopulibacillus cellulosilyticus]|uniref:NAD(P)/FAD-dependent oxidoreductase n=1 Tax=Scopulibacillus cellulosilyticus TaxID=2665665 RepID=A0ABW2Q775_9BACL
METDLLIIGGGPSGLNAAYEPATKGLKVTVVDESYAFGGQLKQQTQFLEPSSSFKRERGIVLRQQLIDRLLPYQVNFLAKHTFIGTYKNGRIGISNGETVIPIHTKKMIIATGAAEDAIVFPGWTLPGVMTVGAAQILMNRELVLPGKDAIILGSHDFALEVAQQLDAVGVKVHGIFEGEEKIAASKPEDIEQIKKLNIPIFLNTVITSAQGKEKVEKVYMEQNGKEMMCHADLVCISGGLSPILESLEIMNCELTYQKELGGWLPKYDINFETSQNSVYVAGNAAGVTSAGALLVTGEIAGTSVLESLGVLTSEEAKERKQRLWKELYQIETSKSNETFNARTKVIKDFHLETNRPLSEEFVFGLGCQ